MQLHRGHAVSWMRSPRCLHCVGSFFVEEAAHPVVLSRRKSGRSLLLRTVDKRSKIGYLAQSENTVYDHAAVRGWNH